MKRKILILSVLAICFATLAAGSLAYFTAEDTAHNVITTGGVNIQIVEKTKGDGGVLLDFPKEGLTGIMPGMEASKIVSVINTGASEAWIRIKMDIAILSADGSELPSELKIDEETIPVIVPNVKENWMAGGDGYYYYCKPVASQDRTTNFLETVTFASQIGNEYQNCTVTLNVTAQAVQTANNPADPAQYGDDAVMHAQGWTAE